MCISIFVKTRIKITHSPNLYSGMQTSGHPWPGLFLITFRGDRHLKALFHVLKPYLLCGTPKPLHAAADGTELKAGKMSQAGKQCLFGMLALWILPHYSESCNHASIWQHYCTSHAFQISMQHQFLRVAQFYYSGEEYENDDSSILYV